MAITCKLGPSAWDLVPYVRAKLEDTDATNYLIPDVAILAYIEGAVEEFSQHSPLDNIVGDPLAGTSPLNTVVSQVRYVCSAANGFPNNPLQITDVLYRAASTYSAANELAYLSILPFSPINRFLFSPNLLDAPSERILRNTYLGELQHYGRGFYGTARDSVTGLMAIDVYPIPNISNIPIFVRYRSRHPNTGPDGNNFVYVTIPEEFKYVMADFVWVHTMEQEADRLAKYERIQAGFTVEQGNLEFLETRIDKTRERCIGSLRGYEGVAVVGGS